MFLVQRCNQTYFSCVTDTAQCIPKSWICDRDPECRDGSDESTDLCQSVGACGGHYSDPIGILYSPNYPENYPDNSYCIYTVSQPNGIFILLSVISILTDRTYPYRCYDDRDFLEIRDGPSAISPLLDKICHDQRQNSLILRTSQNELWMK